MQKNSQSTNGVEPLYGLRAVLALIEQHPSDLLELYCHESLKSQFHRSPKRPVFVHGKKLDQLSKTHQHEGVFAWIKVRTPFSLIAWADQLVQSGSHAIALDRVRNPYNIGSIYRSASFFGIKGLLLGSMSHEDWPHIKRVAEGGFEHVHSCLTTDLLTSIQRLKKDGFNIYGAEDDGNKDLQDVVPKGPSIFILGNEESGIKSSLKNECDHIVRIRGSGATKSLNVAHSATLICHHLFQISHGCPTDV